MTQNRRAVANWLFLGRITAVLAVGLVNHQALANWYGEYIGPETCMPLDHISIQTDGRTAAVRDVGKLHMPKDFANSLQKLGLDLKHQQSVNNAEVQIYSLTDSTDIVDFRFFADRNVCFADANGSPGLPKGPAIAKAPLPPNAPPRAQQPLNTPPQRAPSAPITTAPVPSPPTPPQAAERPMPAKVWIIVLLLGNSPAGTPLSQFYLTKQDCLAHLAKAENDPLIGSATEAGRFRLDCLQLTEANDKIGEPNLPHSRVRPLAKRRHHPTRPSAPIQDWSISNNPPASEQSSRTEVPQ
ncbi:MAG: hypothetical protein JO007_10110 [Alphaproteobacteria bacterium]|nr:hypothetical protein [Alphaproteobacteria bacterium]